VVVLLLDIVTCFMVNRRPNGNDRPYSVETYKPSPNLHGNCHLPETVLAADPQARQGNQCCRC
jgi:hypothetical protein